MRRPNTSSQEGAIRHRTVPSTLIGKSIDEIKEWASSQLNGQEADLSGDMIRRIKQGELKEVVLRPKRKGFFLPDGTFVEAFEFTPEIGGDLDEAEKVWEREEADNSWIDEENERFNKLTLESSDQPVLLMWEHGKRTIEYSTKHNRALYTLQVNAVKRGKRNQYGLYAHQICTDLYLWKNDATPDDPIFTLTWGHIDCIIKFSRDSAIRNIALALMFNLIEEFDFSPNELYLLFGTKDQEKLSCLPLEESKMVIHCRETIRTRNKPEAGMLGKAALVVRKAAMGGDAASLDNRTQ